MNLVKAELLAKKLIAEHLDPEWTFKFSHAKKWLGICDYGKKEIRLSEIHTSKSPEEDVLDTILHEIAHALTPGAGHGPIWKHVAKSIGCSAKVKGKAAATLDEMYSWCISTSCGKPLKFYTRRPSRKVFQNVAYMCVRGKPETVGTLQVVPFRDGKPVIR